MQNFTLRRTGSRPDGTFGALVDEDGNQLCVTCEPPWRGNGPDSCVPPGDYVCIRHDSPEHPWTFELTGVPGRTEILIHTGNTENDSRGCIVVGDGTGTINGLPAVLNSVRTLNKLRAIFNCPFRLTVVENLSD